MSGACAGKRICWAGRARGVAWATLWFVSATLPCRGAAFAAQFGAAAVQQNMIEINENQLVSWVFKDQTTVASALRASEVRLESRLELVAQACQLTNSQRARLLLAGEGDIHRFLNKFSAFRRTVKSNRMTRQAYQALWQRVQPLIQEYARGLHHDESLYAKALRTTLDHEQLRQYDDFERARSRRHYLGMAKGAIAIIENDIPLTAKQRKALLDAIVAQDPPRKSLLRTPYKFYVVLYRVSTIPKEQIRPIFLDNEWDVMSGILQRAQDLRPVLEREGVEFE